MMGTMCAGGTYLNLPTPLDLSIDSGSTRLKGSAGSPACFSHIAGTASEGDEMTGNDVERARARSFSVKGFCRGPYSRGEPVRWLALSFSPTGVLKVLPADRLVSQCLETPCSVPLRPSRYEGSPRTMKSERSPAYMEK